MRARRILAPEGRALPRARAPGVQSASSEIEWNFRDDTDVARLGEEKLAAYNRLLREQAADLQAALDQMYWHPRYEPFRESAGPFGFSLKVDGAGEARRLDHVIATLETGLAGMQRPDALQQVRAAARAHRAAYRGGD